MTTYYKPVAAPLDYPALRNLCGDRLPDTFEAWRAAEDAERRDLVARGHHVIGLSVTPEGLRGFCRASRCRADRAAMAAMVARRGAEIYGSQEDYEAYRAGLVVTEDVRAERPEIVEEGPALVRKRPWWAFWRPKYEVTDVSAAQLEADAAARRRPWWRFGRQEAPVVDLRAPRYDTRASRRPWWAFWRRRETPAVPAE